MVTAPVNVPDESIARTGFRVRDVEIVLACLVVNPSFAREDYRTNRETLLE
jgi:hypothetical protein